MESNKQGGRLDCGIVNVHRSSCLIFNHYLSFVGTMTHFNFGQSDNKKRAPVEDAEQSRRDKLRQIAAGSKASTNQRAKSGHYMPSLPVLKFTEYKGDD